MTDTDLHKWRIIVTATQASEYIWLEDGEEPTVSINGDPIDTAKSRITQTVEQSSVKIQQENSPTGGHFQLYCLAFDAPANTTTEYTHSWPYDISVIGGTLYSTNEMDGNTMTWIVGDNTTIGTITADVSISDTVINVGQTVIDNAVIGYKLELASAIDPVNTREHLGYITAIDTVGLTVTVGIAATQAWAAATPVLVQIGAVYADTVEVQGNAKLTMGTNNIGTSSLPAGTELKCIWNNTNLISSVRPRVYVEYMY